MQNFTRIKFLKASYSKTIRKGTLPNPLRLQLHAVAQTFTEPWTYQSLLHCYGLILNFNIIIYVLEGLTQATQQVLVLFDVLMPPPLILTQLVI